MMVLIFADGANLDDFFANVPIVHSDVECDDVGLTGEDGPDYSSTVRITVFDNINHKDKNYIVHYVYDKDSPAVHFPTFHQIKTFLKLHSSNDFITLEDFISTSIYILCQTFII